MVTCVTGGFDFEIPAAAPAEKSEEEKRQEKINDLKNRGNAAYNEKK